MPCPAQVDLILWRSERLLKASVEGSEKALSRSTHQDELAIALQSREARRSLSQYVGMLMMPMMTKCQPWRRGIAGASMGPAM